MSSDEIGHFEGLWHYAQSVRSDLRGGQLDELIEPLEALRSKAAVFDRKYRRLDGQSSTAAVFLGVFARKLEDLRKKPGQPKKRLRALSDLSDELATFLYLHGTDFGFIDRSIPNASSMWAAAEGVSFTPGTFCQILERATEPPSPSPAQLPAFEMEGLMDEFGPRPYDFVRLLVNDLEARNREWMDVFACYPVNGLDLTDGVLWAISDNGDFMIQLAEKDQIILDYPSNRYERFGLTPAELLRTLPTIMPPLKGK